MRPAATLGSLILACTAYAQRPDVIVAVDLRPTLLLNETRNAQLRWIDPYGLPSTVGFKGRFADGKRFAITQRMARHQSDGDPDQVDEFYLENPGEWKIGKQTLPFGKGQIYRETSLSLRLRTNLVFEGAPIEFSIVDSGPGRPRGIIGRIGNNSGISFAFGDNFAIQDSAFTILRPDSGGLGKARGYRTMLGTDTALFAYPFTFEGELFLLKQGHTTLDEDLTITDIRARYQLPGGRDTLSIGWAKNWDSGQDSFRIDGEFVLLDQLLFKPHIRFGGRGLNQFGTTFRFRL